MAGETLLPSPVGRERTFPDLLELFAASMLRRRAPDELSREVAARAREGARVQVTQARAPLGSQQMLALRAVYDEVRALGSATALEATGESALPGRTRASKTFESMLSLRHRQRAAVLLHDLGGLPTETVAGVIGVARRQVHVIVEGARSAMGARMKEPVNVRHALGEAGRRLINLDAPEIEAPAPARMPRSVVRALLDPNIVPGAAPLDAPAPEAEPLRVTIRERVVGSLLVPDPGRLTDDALVALEASPSDITIAPAVPRLEQPSVLREPIRQKSVSRRMRILLVAACAAIAAVVVPAAARSPKIAPSAPRVSATISTPVVEPARRAVRADIVPVALVSRVVVRGDSLWAIAERHFGDGDRWPEIWKTNRGATMPGGRFSEPDLIMPGWRLNLPPR